MKTRDRNLPTVNFQKLYDHVHSEYPDYGLSPTRVFEYVQNIQPLNFNSVLDVGCGSGQLLKWIKHTRPHVQCCGVDISQIALDKVNIENIALKQGSAQELPFPDNQADLIICTHVLDRIPEPDIYKAIKELKRVGTGHVWIQVSDCDATEEDKYLQNTKFAKMSLLTTRRTIIWWERNISQHLQIKSRQQVGKKISFICNVKRGLL